MSKIDVAGFFTKVQDKYGSEQATERSYYTPLEKLLESINPSL